MPIPKPRADQNEEDYIGFCMADPTMNADYPDNSQRYAICIGTWQDKNKTITEGVNQMDAIKEILPKLKPNKRIFADLSITDSPDDGTFHEHGADAWKNYSVGIVWVEDFSDFVLRSKGFQVF